MQIREHNLRRYKMLRTQMGLKYEADLTNQEKKQIRHDEGRYHQSYEIQDRGGVFNPVGEVR